MIYLLLVYFFGFNYKISVPVFCAMGNEKGGNGSKKLLLLLPKTVKVFLDCGLEVLTQRPFVHMAAVYWTFSRCVINN